MPALRILGTRGVPAAHGGFETFAEHLALYLSAKGWTVVVYCQDDGSGPTVEDDWRGVRRVRIPIALEGPKGTVLFDWKATLHASQSRDLCLTLGYNTAVFAALLRVKGIANVFNMDGVEWARAKWGVGAKTWFYVNDWAGCWLGNHLVADHPEIRRHLSGRVSERKITMIPYGADAIDAAPSELVTALGLVPSDFVTVVARPEPENSLLEIVSAFSRHRRGCTLAVLGTYRPRENAYHRAVIRAASSEVKFLGAIYDKSIVQALRFHSRAYVHGHQVGGTNPSLVEALGAGCPVIAHDNPYNRWVAGPMAKYFADIDECASRFDEVLNDWDLISSMRSGSRIRHEEAFTWPNVLAQYEQLLSAWA